MAKITALPWNAAVSEEIYKMEKEGFVRAKPGGRKRSGEQAGQDKPLEKKITLHQGDLEHQSMFDLHDVP